MKFIDSIDEPIAQVSLSLSLSHFPLVEIGNMLLVLFVKEPSE